MEGGVIIKTKQTTLRMPEDLSSILKKVSTQKGLCQNSLILNILWEWAEKYIENWKGGKNGKGTDNNTPPCWPKRKVATGGE